jgi:hypothetical protein
MSNMSKKLWSIYTIILLVVGVFFVPNYLMYGYGADSNIVSVEYVPIWKLKDLGTVVNDSFLRYELCLPRIIYTLVIVTVIFVALHFTFYKKDKKDKKD